MIKQALKKLTPDALLKWRSSRIAKRRQDEFSDKSAAETFSEIYASRLWGDDPGGYCSGEGSDEIFARQYAALIREFISDNGVNRIVDLGCGDFRVASEFVSDEIDYTGIDIVAPLIERNQELYGSPRVRFHCMDIGEDELPDGDVCLIRQVLQHLSNTEIAKILANCRKYRFLIVTEHYPSPDTKVTPNIDIPHGPGMRVYYDSAVFLDQPPFSLENVTLLLDVEAEDKTRIKSFLVKNDQAS